MGRSHVDHADIVRFSDECVNLKREDAKEMRQQVWRLRDRLEAYLKDYPNFALRKILLSGSLAKGTALKALNDVDVACYISSENVPESIGELIDWLVERLRKAFPNFKPEQVTSNTYSVTVSFVGTGLKVDVVPILYDGDPDWKGYLVSQDTGDKLLTSIPMHMEFIRRRKNINEIHYAQVVRLLKYWVKQRKLENDQFRFKSFMVELILAHLADQGLALNDYPKALERFFTFIGTDDFATTIAFSDYYDPARCTQVSNPIRIWDPVNCQNNVAKLYTTTQKELIVDEALEAGDAISSAERATTKGGTLRYWRKVFGPAFEV